MASLLLDQNETSQDRDNQTQKSSSWLQRREEKRPLPQFFMEPLVIWFCRLYVPVVMVVNFLQISTNFPKNYHHVLFGCRKWIWATWKSCWTIAAEKYILLLQHCSKSKRLYFVVVLQQKSIWNHMGLLAIFYRSYSTTYRISRARKMLQVVLDLK